MPKHLSLLAEERTMQQIEALAQHWGYNGKRVTMRVIARCVEQVHQQELPAPDLLEACRVLDDVVSEWDGEGLRACGSDFIDALRLIRAAIERHS